MAQTIRIYISTAENQDLKSTLSIEALNKHYKIFILFCSRLKECYTMPNLNLTTKGLFMKKLLKSAVLSLALVATFSITLPAQATVSLLTLNGPLAVQGLAVFLPSLFTGSIIEEGGIPEGYRKPLYIISTIGFFVGAIILDKNQSMSFAEVSFADAERLNLSKEEVASFNSEIDQANALLEEAEAELSKLSNPSLKDSRMIWASLKDTVSPETFSAMQKITFLTQK